MANSILDKSWHLTPEGLEQITSNNQIKDKQIILKNALDTDLKDIGNPTLSKEQFKSNIESLVLQIQKVRNVSAPKANEASQAAPRMLKLVLTDGENYIQAIETSPISGISLDKTPPGSKILISSAKVCSGYILLTTKNCSYLGGKVPALYDKWEIAKSIQSYHRHSNNDGPPAWVNFGSKLQSNIATDKPFKSLDNKTKENVKDNSEFELQRQGAIAEATSGSGAVKKVFGGGVKQIEKNPAIKPYNRQPQPPREDRKNKSKSAPVEPEDKPLPPTGKISLFDFLENKLPVSEVPPEPQKPSNNYKQQNTYPQNNNRNMGRPGGYNRDRESSGRQNNYQKYNNGPNYNNRQERSINELSKTLDNVSLNNSQFATRSLRQHLHLPMSKQQQQQTDVVNPWNWRIGDNCMAKYWEDGKYYNANITAITDKTCVVQFKGYGNIEEILKADCLPVFKDDSFKGTMEFRRNNRTYKKN